MTNDQLSQLINAQYGRNNLIESILEALRTIGKTPGNVTLEDLAPLDHFHGGGYQATLELARRANVQPDQRVLASPIIHASATRRSRACRANRGPEPGGRSRRLYSGRIRQDLTAPQRGK